MYQGRATSDWDHTSVLWALIANVNRDEKQKPEPYTPYDIHPYRQQEQRRADEVSGFWTQVGRLRTIGTTEGQLAALDSLLKKG
jgi:hypothetical protein